MKLEERKLAIQQIRLDLHRMSFIADNAYHNGSVTESDVISLIQQSEIAHNRCKKLLKDMRTIMAA